jgi:hypothetical protein
MGDRAVVATRMQVVSQSGRRSVRRSAVLAATVGIALWSLAVSPTAAQVRPGPAADAIDRSRGLSTQPRPARAAPELPTERLVPESRQRELGTGKEIVTPPYYDRSTPDRPWQMPPSASYGTPGAGPTSIPGR